MDQCAGRAACRLNPFAFHCFLSLDHPMKLLFSFLVTCLSLFASGGCANHPMPRDTDGASDTTERPPHTIRPARLGGRPGWL
jgi:hypothetical protein